MTRRRRAVLVLVATGFAIAGGPSFAAVDQSNLTSVGNLVVDQSQTVGQTFTVGVAGLLTGIEFAPLLDRGASSDLIFLELFDGVQSLGTCARASRRGG
jgi:hypothetical protein